MDRVRSRLAYWVNAPVFDSRGEPLVVFHIWCTFVETGDCRMFGEIDVVLRDGLMVAHVVVIEYLGRGMSRVGFHESSLENFFENLAYKSEFR